MCFVLVPWQRCSGKPFSFLNPFIKSLFNRPTLALKGSTDDAVKYAATQMRKFQMKVFKAAFIAITALFVGSTIISYAIYQQGVAILTMFVYFFVYIILVLHGFATYRRFNPTVDGAFLEPDAVGYHADGRKMTSKEYKEEAERKEKERLQDALEVRRKNSHKS
jgi:hypothetical protein